MALKFEGQSLSPKYSNHTVCIIQVPVLCPCNPKSNCMLKWHTYNSESSSIIRALSQFVKVVYLLRMVPVMSTRSRSSCWRMDIVFSVDLEMVSGMRPGISQVKPQMYFSVYKKSGYRSMHGLCLAPWKMWLSRCCGLWTP
jgi:hypothetical protein